MADTPPFLVVPDPTWPRRRAAAIVDDVLRAHALRAHARRARARDLRATLAAVQADLKRRDAARREAALEPWRAYGRAARRFVEGLEAVAAALAEGYNAEVAYQHRREVDR